MKICAPAKINLTLEIVGLRSDNFHEIGTWMVPIALYDILEIEQANEAWFASNTPELTDERSNLVIRAAQAFATAASIRSCYRIRLHKNIPIGAGLGGGSSDAAATLQLLNQLHGEPLTAEQLHELAAKIGSDVAFFLAPRPAWCSGRGEIMTPRGFASDLWVCLFKPGFNISTADAYRAYATLPAEQKRGSEHQTRWGLLRNDLEPAVFAKFVLLPVIKQWLMTRPETLFTLMSGSGSTVFALIESPSAGESLRGHFEREFGVQFWTAICRLHAAADPH